MGGGVVLREWLEEEIERARRRRDFLRDGMSSLQSLIAYHKKRGNTKRVRELERELVELRKEYEEAKNEFWSLVRKWQKLTAHGSS